MTTIRVNIRCHSTLVYLNMNFLPIPPINIAAPTIYVIQFVEYEMP